MSYTAPTIDPVAGVLIPSLADTQAQAQAVVQAAVGSDVYIDPDGADAQIIDGLAQMIHDVNQLGAAIFGGFGPGSRMQAMLINLAALCGVKLKAGSYAIYSVPVQGVPGTVIPYGAVVSFSSQPSMRLGSIQSCTLDSNGAGSLYFEATTKGALSFNPATDTVSILTPVAGWQTAGLPATSVTLQYPGAAQEGLAAFRQRRAQSVALTSKSITDGLRGDLLDIPLVANAVVYEKKGSDPTGDQDNWVVNGVTYGPAPTINGLWCVVLGGDPVVIAKTIYAYLGQGVQLVGSDISQSVPDAQGFLHVIPFSRPVGRDVSIRLSFKGSVAGDPVSAASIATYLTGWCASQDTNNPIGSALSWVQVLDAIKTGMGLDVRTFGMALGDTPPTLGAAPADISSAAMGKDGIPLWSTANVTIDQGPVR